MGIGEFRPVPKPTPKDKKPRKKKNPQLYRGRIIPKQKERTKITKENYNRMIEEFGNYCQECGHVPIFAHHLVFRSNMGSGNWRNLAPLCLKCHERAHKEFEFAEYLRNKRAERFGLHFAEDKWSLFQVGLIPNTEDNTFERFMIEQEKGNK